MHFEVNGSKQLHLQWAGSDTSVLATPNARIGETEWNFWVKLSFNTSANNLLRVYLTADRKELDQPLTGCFLQVGGAGDSLTIIRQEGTGLIPLFHFPDGSTSQSTNSLRVKIIRDAAGFWSSWIDPEGGVQFVEQGSWSDYTSQYTAWFGFWCKYTSSNAAKFYMDDVYVGPVIHDTIPPKLVLLTIPDSLHLKLIFSEALEVTTVQILSHFTLLGDLSHPIEASVPSGQPEQVMLTFSESFAGQVTDTLLIESLTDPAGNRMHDTLAPFTRFSPGAFDILIHEILADPEPAVGMPLVEYVELYNTTTFPVNLAGWSFDAGTNRESFPAVTIQPHGYLLLACDSTLATFGPTLPLFTSAFSLSNEGAALVLRNERQQIIHAVRYSPDWITESWKKDGGWSLELMDPDNPCGCDENWNASQDPSGGTPGRANSVHRTNPDEEKPEVLRSFLADANTWAIRFTESLDTTILGDLSSWSLDPGSSHPASLAPVPPDYRLLNLRFNEPFLPGILYTLTGTHDLTDCTGNLIDTPVITMAGIPEPIMREDIIINEILFDPLPGVSRFIELFNRSGNLADLRELAWVVSDTGSAAGTTTTTLLTGESFLLFPLDFVAVCASEKGIKQQYHSPNPKQFLEMDPFPQMKNESGSVGLIRSGDEELIDRMEYHNGMHYPLLTSAEGVSLERISPERPAADPSNWHSAGENTGYATPAYENSQWVAPHADGDEVAIHPPVFSPDNDGRDDEVSIGITLEEPGYQVTILIYDAAGRKIRQVASNALAGCRSEFTWDGIREDRTKASMGIYLVYIELVHPGGAIKKFRKPLVVGGIL